jgi:hypothetical protein
MYTDVLRIGAGLHPALDAGVHARTRSLGADDGAYRQPARMIESGAMIHVFVSAKANSTLGGSGPGLGARCPPRAGTPSSWMGATADAHYLI